jgi:hypothetical protein
MLQHPLVSLEERQRVCQHQRGLPGQMTILKAVIVYCHISLWSAEGRAGTNSRLEEEETNGAIAHKV